jgi:hypothetical protein
MRIFGRARAAAVMRVRIQRPENVTFDGCAYGHGADAEAAAGVLSGVQHAGAGEVLGCGDVACGS